ncbi:hypothetical protein ACWCQZ_50035 [Streptomyces sp. NPDC002285]
MSQSLREVMPRWSSQRAMRIHCCTVPTVELPLWRLRMRIPRSRRYVAGSSPLIIVQAISFT